MTARTLLLTGVAMLCFAANSLLCRLALAPQTNAGSLIDWASFTTLRVLAASAMLVLVVWLRRRHLPRLAYVRARSAVALFVYLAFFSFAYTRLAAGTGALVLFAAVQMTMFASALGAGERFAPAAWAGLAVAVGGLVYLVLPGVTQPDPLGAAAMAVAGAAWGCFSLFARGVDHPVESNAANFLCCLVPAAIVSLGQFATSGAAPHVTSLGLAYAVASGALASGLGYCVWYLALAGLPAGRAATVQLSVPAIAALGGALFLAEPLTTRLLVASATMLGGIAIVLLQRQRR